MAHRGKPQAKDEPMETTETVYRGRKIRIERSRAGDDPSASRLYIDDEILMEMSDSGVISHDMAFEEYGSLGGARWLMGTR